MTLNDTGAHIAAYLLGVAAAAAFIAVLVSLRRRRYQGPDAELYAGFRTGARARGGQMVLLECEGLCDGATAHETADETADEDTATCVLCGTTRQVPAPDPA